MGCGSGILKIILFITNTAFFLLGTGMLAVGILILLVDLNLGIKEFLDTFNESIYDTAVWTLIILGAFLFLMGLLGCCGACCSDSCMLCTNIVFATILIIFELIAVVFVGIGLGNISGNLEETMQGQIKNDFWNDSSVDPVTGAWNVIQEEFECCGAADYRDYENSTYTLNTGESVPGTCCNDDVSACRAEADNGTNPRCDAGQPTTGTWHHLHPCGCYTGVADKLEVFGGATLGIFLAAMACQVGLIIFTCCLNSAVKENKVGYV